MESTYYSIQEASQYLEVVESEIPRLVLVCKQLRPIIFVNESPPFNRQSVFVIERETDPLDLHLPLCKGHITVLNYKPEYVYLQFVGEEAPEFPYEGKDPNYGLIPDVNGKVSYSLTPAVVMQDFEGNDLEFVVTGAELPQGANDPIIHQTTQLLCPVNVAWVFHIDELKRCKYGNVTNKNSKPRQLLQDRAETIIKTLIGLGHDPLSLPRKVGVSGPKSDVRRKLINEMSDTFPNDKAFENAWQVARNNKDIVDK